MAASGFEPSHAGFTAFQAGWGLAGAQRTELKLEKENQSCRPPKGSGKNLRLWPEHNGKPLKGLRGGGREMKLKFQKIPLAAEGGGWELTGAWGLVGGCSLPAQRADNGGSGAATSSAEWSYAAGIARGRRSEGNSHRDPGWEAGEERSR